KLFHPLAFTMNFALIGAVLVTLTITPVLTTFFLTKKPLTERVSPLVKFSGVLFRPWLIRAIRHPKVLLFPLALLLIFSMWLFGQVGSEFLPNLDEGNIWLRVTVLPTSVSLEKSVQVAREIRTRILHYPEVKNIISQIG